MLDRAAAAFAGRACCLALGHPRRKQCLAFGFGPHFCVGNALARMELDTVFNAMLSRMSNLQLAGEPEPVLHSFVRDLTKLPVSFQGCHNRTFRVFASDRMRHSASPTFRPVSEWPLPNMRLVGPGLACELNASVIPMLSR